MQKKCKIVLNAVSAMPKVIADSLEIRRLRNLKDWSAATLATAAGIGVRTVKLIEAEGRATEKKLHALGVALRCPNQSADLKPVLLSGSRLVELRETRERSQDDLALEVLKIGPSLGEEAVISTERIRELERHLTAPAMHHEWRLLTAALGVAPQELLALSSSHARGAPSVDVLGQCAERWRQHILARQHYESGNFLLASSWSTAQLLLALLSFPEGVDEFLGEIHRSLAYFDKARVPGPIPDPSSPDIDQGWRLYDHLPYPVAITEVTCWVLLAQAAALRQPGIRDAVEVSLRRHRIIEELRLLLSRQWNCPWNPHDGAFSPSVSVQAENVRTYTTCMALWTLTMTADLVPSSAADLRAKLASSIDRAVLWLLRHHDPSRGWIPNPGRLSLDEEIYPGLTAQILYVLAETRRTRRLSRLKGVESQLHLTENAFLDSMLRYAPSAKMYGRAFNQNVEVCDTFLGGTPPVILEAMTFYWWPWTLALLARLAERPNYKEPSERERLLALLDLLVDKTRSGPRQEWEISFYGECLFATGIALQAKKLLLA